MMRKGRNGEGKPSLKIGKGKAKVDEEGSNFGSVTDRGLKRVPKEGRSRVRSKRKKMRGYSAEGEVESLVRLASGRCKSRVAMEEFGKVLDELALIDIKPDKGLKPINEYTDPRLFFKYEVYWAKDKDAKNLVRKVCEGNNNSNFIECLEMIRSVLGP
ncbi:hypothetical protein GOBAR_AA10686 [Gossypium barbadense]|uniref:Uncharacterized protein n=1 Tax=Gossypium barbadense TaxID=3634 RepID=A0A2P5Y2X4_GOSBA|nr:hypothetical protein GOBAR_AA10686 [Gossypium barbadense]